MRRASGPQMLQQNAPDFRHRLRIPLGVVAGGNDQFGLGTVQMAAGISDKAIGSFFRRTRMLLPDDAVKRHRRWNS